MEYVPISGEYGCKQLTETSYLIVVQYLCCSCSSNVRGLLRQGITIAIAAGLGELPFWVRGIVSHGNGENEKRIFSMSLRSRC